ncbi:MAG: hypothetical protein ACRD82_04880, partial [Blastocatellia bacterium]
MAKASLLAGLLVAVLAASASAQLSSADQTAMTGALETLSQKWDQPSVNVANGIIGKSQYTAAHWQSYFGSYFSTHRLTPDLWGYAVYPAFYWLSESEHYKLQVAFLPVAKDRINSAFQNHPSDLGQFLNASQADRDELVSWLRFMWNVGARAANGIDRRVHFDWTKQLIASHPNWLSAKIIDPASQPFANAVRMQVHIILRDALELTPAVKQEVTTILGLTGTKLQLWNAHSTLIHDNQFLLARDLAFIQNYWNAVPAPLARPGNISVNDALGNSGAAKISGDRKSGINIFAIHIGYGKNNEFPSDVSPFQSDTFAMVAVHELNHGVEAFDIQGNPVLKARQEELIKDAGADQLNYLRSWYGDDFFVKSPQEFFASMSNSYAANTALTLD